MNGFAVSSNSAQISVSPINLQGTKLSVKITVGASTTISKIWLSWLAFSPSTASFGSYGGQVSQNKYSGSISSDVSSSLYQNTYTLYGLNLVSVTSSQSLQFTSDIDNSFVLTISASSQIDSFALIYVAFGVLPSKVCSNCGQGLVASGADCVSGCPAGTYSFGYKDGGVACRTCSSKLGLMLASGRCVAATTTTTTVTTTTTLSANLPTTTQSSSTATQTTNSTRAQSTQATTSNAQTTATQTTSSANTKPSGDAIVFKPSCPPNAHFV